MSHEWSKGSQPQVDVVMPLYNKAAWVTGSVESVFAQTFDSWRLIIVDDGSTDRSLDELGSFLDDPRVSVVRQANRGPGAARNRGAKEGDAALLAFLDADDQWSPTFLERTVEALVNHGECAMVGTSEYRGTPPEDRSVAHEQQGISSHQWRCPTQLSFVEVKDRAGFFKPSGVLVRRESFDLFGGYFDRDRCTFGEDTWLFLQIMLNKPVLYIVEPLIWRNTDASELADGRTTPYPVPPHLQYADEVRATCPDSHQVLLGHFIVEHSIWTARRLAWQGQGRTARALLRARVDRPRAADEDVRRIILYSRLWPAVRARRRIRRLLHR